MIKTEAARHDASLTEAELEGGDICAVPARATAVSTEGVLLLRCISRAAAAGNM